MLPFSVALRAGNRAADAWSPAQLGASLLGWWTADRQDLITLQAGSKVSSWLDVVAGYDLTQGTDDARPIYSATGFNGRPGVTSDGLDDDFTLASVPFPSGASAAEIWALADLPGSGTNLTIFAYGGALTTNHRGLRFSTVSTVFRSIFDAGTGVANGTNINDNVAITAGRHIIRGVVTGTETYLDVDGGNRKTLSVVPGTGTTRTRMFADTSASGARFIAATMSDLLITSILTAAQEAQLLAYLSVKRG